MSKSDRSTQMVLGGGGDIQLSIFGIIWNAITSNFIVGAVMFVLIGSFLYWRNVKTHEALLLVQYTLLSFTIVMVWVVFWTYRNEKAKRSNQIRLAILVEKLRERKAKVYYQLDWIKSQHNILTITHKNILEQTAEILENPTNKTITPLTMKAIAKTLRKITTAIYDNLDDIKLDFEIFKKKWYDHDDFPIYPELDLETLSHTKELERLLEETEIT